MATGWGTLGSVLGGGIDREGAYEEGRLHTAQTEAALGRARDLQLKNIADAAQQKKREGFRTALAKSGQVAPEQIDLMDAVVGGGLGSDFSSGMTGLKTGQEIGNRNVLGDASAAPADQFAAGQAVQGKVLNPYDMVGQSEYTDLRAGAPGLETTPLGDSLIAENNATTNLRNVQAGDPDYKTVSGAGTAGGVVKPETGYYANPAYDPSRPNDPANPMVLPVTGGSKDPNAPPKLGVNALAQFARVLNAAGNTALDLGNIMEMPSGASTGIFGKPGTSLMAMIPGNLTNVVSPTEVQEYRAIIGTLGEQLATIERMGMRGSAGLSAQFDNLALLPTDTVFTKMLKLAQMRQTVENGMDTLISLNAMPPDMEQRAVQLRDTVSKSVPFTPRDVFELQKSEKPGMTLGELLAQKKFTQPVSAAPAKGATPAAPAAPAAAAPPPARNAQGWELLEDAEGNLAYVSPDGSQIEEVQR